MVLKHDGSETIMNKSDIRLLNNVYRRSKLGLLRYPLSENDALYADSEHIKKLLESGHLIIKSTDRIGKLGYERIEVSKLGKQFVSDNAKWYVGKKLKDRKASAERNRRRSDIDFYKHERNPFMGSKLIREGGKVICTECNAINKPCEHGDEFLQRLPPDARPPKANASKTRWKAFKNLFIRK